MGGRSGMDEEESQVRDSGDHRFELELDTEAPGFTSSTKPVMKFQTNRSRGVWDQVDVDTVHIDSHFPLADAFDNAIVNLASCGDGIRRMQKLAKSRAIAGSHQLFSGTSAEQHLEILTHTFRERREVQFAVFVRDRE